jgi:hypothetical protein
MFYIIDPAEASSVNLSKWHFCPGKKMESERFLLSITKEHLTVMSNMFKAVNGSLY